MTLGELMESRFSQSSAAISNRSDDFSSHEDVDFAARRRDSETTSSSYSATETPTVTSMTYLPQTMVLCELRHEAFQSGVTSAPMDSGVVSKWRLKDRMRTGYVAIVLCLNISVDPPDVIKISPCARMECWIDPFSMTPQKAIETIGRTLSMQYERWQPRARYKIQRDPTVEEVKKLCTSCRKCAKSERVLFHYNGHGVPKPTANGEIWLFNKSYTQYVPLPVVDLDSWLSTPSIYVFDCSAAGMIVNAFMELHNWSHSGNTGTTRDCILLAACEAHETLPQSADFPADVFTSCLTTPIKMALRWFLKRSLLSESFDYVLIDQIPGRQNDRKTPLGELNWIFTAVTDTIAWNVLPRDLFQRLFRQDLLVASLFRNFLLAQRIMRSVYCSPISYPLIPPAHHHHMWDAWDMAAEICLSQLQPLIDDPNAEFQPSPFFTEQLTAFEVWLEHGSEHKKPPEQLPIVLQVLLSQGHRFRALVLLGRFLDMGSWAVDLALSVGIFPYVLKLLPTTTPELRQILVFIWTKILVLDKSCQVDLVKDGGHIYFIKFLDSVEAYPEQRAMAAFVIAVIVDGHRRGQEACIEAGLLHICLKYIRSSTDDAQAEPLFVQWLCLCLAKLWEDFAEAQSIALQEDAFSTCGSLVAGPQPEVRASAVYALSTLLDIGLDSFREGVGDGEFVDDDAKIRAEMTIIKSLLGVVSDGSPLVRAEVAFAMSRFALSHSKHLKAIAAALWKPHSTSVMNSIPLGHTKTPPGGHSSTNQYISHGIRPVLRVGSDNPTPARDVRVSTSSPLASILNGSPVSDDVSRHSDSGTLSSMASKPLDNTMYSQCVLAMYILANDPFPHISVIGHRVLAIAGIENMVPKPAEPKGSPSKLEEGCAVAAPQPPTFSSLVRSSSWFDMNTGHLPITFRTPPVSPPRPSYLRRVYSSDFRYLLNSQSSALSDPCVSSSQSSGASDRSFLPQSTIYNWSCAHFSKPLLNISDDAEEALNRREERDKLALDLIAKCQHSTASKLSNNQIACWDTKFEPDIKATLLHPFSPIVVAADERETVRVWNYKEATLVNSFENQCSSESGISSLCLLNELDHSLLLIASGDGNIRVWREYAEKSEQKLVTAFSSIHGCKNSARSVNAVVDWQQQVGYLFVAGEMSSIMLWDLDKEQLIKPIPSFSESAVSALSASQVHGGQFAAGFSDGYVRFFDVRTPKMMLFALPHTQRVERIVGIGFGPGLGVDKLVSASQAGHIQLLDLRSQKAYHTFDARQGSLSALAVHRHAPVIATGSGKQVIKIFNLEGNNIGTIRYYPTFMAQQIGSVCCLAFHPFQVVLTAGANDGYVSIYADEDTEPR